MSDTQYEFLHAKFLEAMNDIGRYGKQKYGNDIAREMKRKDGKRWEPDHIGAHASLHFNLYLEGEPHDHFDTKRHQLAAVAFNAMMEFCFAGLDSEQ